MSPKFKLGELIILNSYGIFITSEYENKIGIIISERYNIVSNVTPLESPLMDMFHLVYDVLLEGELFKMIPEEFMEKFNLDEEDNK